MAKHITLSPFEHDTINLFVTNEARAQAKLVKGLQHWRARLPSYADRLKELESLDSLDSKSVFCFPFRYLYFKHLTHQIFSHLGLSKTQPLPHFPLFLVTVAAKRDRRRSTYFNTPLRSLDFQAMRKRVHSILKGYHYVGHPDIGVYVYTGYETSTYRELSPHYHLLVWGCTEKELKERFKGMKLRFRISCKFRRIKHQEVQKYSRRTKERYLFQWSLGRAFSYVHKFVCKEKVLSRRMKETVDKDGVVHPVGESQEYERQIPGNKSRVLVFRWVKDLPLFDFCVAGGDGVRLMKAAKRGGLREFKRAKDRLRTNLTGADSVHVKGYGG